VQTENEKAVLGHMRDAFFAIHGEGKLDSTDEEFGLQCFKEGAAWQAAIIKECSSPKVKIDEDGENQALRSFLLSYGCGNHTIEGMRNHLRLSGFKGCWPEWANDATGHLTKGGAQNWIRHILALEEREKAQPEPVATTPAAPASQESAPGQERAAFEAWGESIGFPVTGKYAETVDVLCAESAFKAGYKAGRAALTAQPATAPTPPAQTEPSDALTFDDAVRIARGCTDYGGGYRGEPELFDAYQAGISTVITALTAAGKEGLSDSQVRALHSMGAQPAAATTAPSDENGGHRLVEPDHETALALADAPRSLRNYVAALQAENERRLAERDALAAALQSQVSNTDGWVMVPVDPTNAMVEAAELDSCGLLMADDIRDAYCAMLAAAPQPPAEDAKPEQQEQSGEAVSAADAFELGFQFANALQSPMSGETRHIARIMTADFWPAGFSECAKGIDYTGTSSAAIVHVKRNIISKLSTLPATPTATAKQESASGQEAVAPIGYIDRLQLERWERLRGTEFEVQERAYIGFSTKPFTSEMTDCTLPVYLAPPTSTAIAAMVIKQAADIVVDRAHTPYAKNWDEVAETIRNLLPANAEEELVKVILKVINEAQEYTEEGVSRVLDSHRQR
jgi:hypothetical protein